MAVNKTKVSSNIELAGEKSRHFDLVPYLGIPKDFRF